LAALVKVANAMAVQASRDLAPIWNVAGSVVALPDPDHIDPGIWPIYIVDQLDPGLGGYHQTEHNQPFAMVVAGDTWSLSASHEAIEMLVDPSGNRLVASAAVAVVDEELRDVAGKFEYLLEVCDPSEDQSSAYLIDDVLVSDFYTPSYFDPAGTAGGRYSFSGRLTRPRQVLPNGYLSWYNPSNNKIQQARHFGAPEIVDLATGKPGAGSLTGGRSLRSFVDSKTPPVALSSLHPKSHAVERLKERVDFLATAASSRASMFAAAASRVLGSERVPD
jgi:hypothetical protein